MSNTALIQRKKASASEFSSYAVLRRKVKERMLLGQKRVEEEKVRTYWEVGRMINEHIMIHGGRAEYNEQVIQRLSKDLQLSYQVLYKTRQFAEVFPNFSTWRNLDWSHFRALLSVGDEKQRRKLAALTERNGWDARELEAQIREWKQAEREKSGLAEGPVALLTAPSLGALYTYRIFQPKAVGTDTKPTLKIDLGFRVYVDPQFVRAPRNLKEGDIVRSDADTIVKKGTASDLFTYRAVVEDVTDGDTLRVQIDLGLGMWVRQYLRLTHINGPELKTKEGRAAREFVLREIRRSPIVTLRTTKHDKFDRYLADVFLEDGTYLNQRILDAGHAVRIQADTTK